MQTTGKAKGLSKILSTNPSRCYAYCDFDKSQKEAKAFKQILVATDGSAAAKRAVDTAADLAQKYQASLTVFHVMRKM